MKKLTIMILTAAMTMALASCKKNEPRHAEDAQPAQAPQAGEEKPANPDDASTDEAKPSEAADVLDPDGLYKTIRDPQIPFPLRDGKAAKYDESWKEGQDGLLMDGYIYNDITQEFIDDYKKRLEDAGFVNGRSVEAPPIYIKKAEGDRFLRVDLSDDFCKPWSPDGCDPNQKTGSLTVQILDYIDEHSPEIEPDRQPSPNADEILAGYNDPKDPEKLYAGMPNSLCVFPNKAGNPIAYGYKEDLLDADCEPGTAFYTFNDDGSFEKTYEAALKKAGFKDGVKEDDAGRCTITMDGGEGEMNVRMKYEKKSK